MKFSVLGCGRWGSFIGWYLSGLGFDVIQWGRSGHPSFDVLEKRRENEYVKLNENTVLTSELKIAVENSDYLVISISSQSLRAFLKELKCFGIKDKKFILCMKGIEVDTGKRLSEVLIESGIDKNNVCVWLGPGHIQSFTSGKPNCMVIDGYDKNLVKFFADNLRSDLIRFYYGDDIIGNEIGAAAKNVIGIASGMLEAGGYETLKGPLMTRGAREVSRLIKALGGSEMSAYGLCHLGDFETTLFSKFSNNRAYGEAYIKGEKFPKLAEGVTTAKALKELGERFSVDLPITNAVYDILYNNANPMQAFNKVFSRSTRKEF